MSNCLLKMTLTNLLKNWNTGEDIIKETKKKIASTHIGHKSGTDLTPTEQLQRGVEIESVKKTLPICL